VLPALASAAAAQGAVLVRASALTSIFELSVEIRSRETTLSLSP
jgi:hypothetical protein